MVTCDHGLCQEAASRLMVVAYSTKPEMAECRELCFDHTVDQARVRRAVEAHKAARYHLTMTGFNAGATLCGGPKLPEDRHAAWNGSLWNAPRDVLVADGCCPECAALWTTA